MAMQAPPERLAYVALLNPGGLATIRRKRMVYRKLGLALLRKAWFNFDVLWGAALVVTGLFTLLMMQAVQKAAFG
jgi:hypothetical protein